MPRKRTAAGAAAGATSKRKRISASAHQQEEGRDRQGGATTITAEEEWRAPREERKGMCRFSCATRSYAAPVCSSRAPNPRCQPSRAPPHRLPSRLSSRFNGPQKNRGTKVGGRPDVTSQTRKNRQTLKRFRTSDDRKKKPPPPSCPPQDHGVCARALSPHLDVFRLALRPAHRLVNHHPRVRQCHALPLRLHTYNTSANYDACRRVRRGCRTSSDDGRNKGTRSTAGRRVSRPRAQASGVELFIGGSGKGGIAWRTYIEHT